MTNTIVCTADWHININTPVSRLPGYQQQQFDKIAWVLEYCQQSKSDLYIAGDLFEKAREPRRLLNIYLKLFADHSNVNIYACAGQHDQLWHARDLADTNIQILFASGMVNHIGSDWGADLLEHKDEGILLAHYCVTDKPNKFIEYSVTANAFMNMVANRIVITGDYHIAHYLKIGDRLLLNPGSIMREASDTINRKPSIYLLDITNLDFEKIYIPVQPANIVFDMALIQNKASIKDTINENKIDIEKYIDIAKKQASIRPNFPQCVNQVIEEVNPNELVKKEVEEVMSNVYTD